MLYRLEKMLGMSLSAVDGEIGTVKDIYFEDDKWVIRYFIVQTGNWMEDLKVLVSPIAVESIDWAKRTIRSRLTRQQVRNCPGFDADKPIYRQNEMAYFAHYGYPTYWDGDLLWGATPSPSSVAVGSLNARIPDRAVTPFDPHLRSLREINGYHIHAKDGSIGHLEDFLIDEENWAIRLVIVDTHNWLPGRHVTIPPRWILALRWKDKRVDIDVTTAQMLKAPEYDPDLEFSHALDEDFDRHYARPGHWE